MIVRSNMCRAFSQAVRMDYSGLDVGGGLVGRAAGRGPAEIATTLRNMPGPACVMRAQRDGIHPSSIRAGPPRTMRAQLTSPKRHPGGGGIVEGSREQDRRDDDAPGRRGSLPRRRRAPRTLATPPGAGPTGTLFQRRLATARAPRGGAHRRMAHRIPGRAPTPPGQTRRRTVRPARPTRPDPVSSRPRGRGVPL